MSVISYSFAFGTDNLVVVKKIDFSSSSKFEIQEGATCRLRFLLLSVVCIIFVEHVLFSFLSHASIWHIS